MMRIKGRASFCCLNFILFFFSYRYSARVRRRREERKKKKERRKRKGGTWPQARLNIFIGLKQNFKIRPKLVAE